MSRYLRAQRLRLLLGAGIAAPMAMALAGAALAYFLRGEVLDVARWPTLRTFGIAAVTAGLSMGMVYVLAKSHPVFERALRNSGGKVGEEALRIAGYPVMLVVVSAAGMAEEVLFRGGLQPSVGVVPAALLFGFSHGGWRREMWAYVVAAALSGGLFGLVYHLTRDLWIPVVAHILHNLAATFLLARNDDSGCDGEESV